MFLAALYDPRFAEYQNVGELAPIFVVMVDDQGDLGILADILQPF